MNTLTIVLDWDRLITEIHNTTYFTGRSRFTGDNPEQVANMQSDEEEECLIRRYLHSGVQRVHTALSAVLEQPLLQQSEFCDALENTPPVSYRLRIPSHFDRNQIPAITASIHQALIAHTVGEWFLISNPGEAAVYFEKANAALSDLRSAIHKRIIPLRRKTNP